ncbi:hypothetical protein ENSA7_81740 [Enhygromyxa salina]|uniref:Uncharacterized protein n=1 Tax=Enhygromyxa salina TaxID=215803 RepID=A0A2S9XGX4_9BACT|nr:hypothetical protein ENSA7_81740 [Enhygromyxa salina]
MLGLEPHVLVAALLDDRLLDPRLLGSTLLLFVEGQLGLAHELRVVLLWKPVSPLFERRSTAVAKHEADAIGGPAVEVFGRRECRVTSHQDLLETSATAQRDGFIEEFGGALARRPVAASVDQKQRLVGVRQRNQQRVVAPDALVGHVHAFPALASGPDDAAVDIDASGLPQQRLASPLPDFYSRIVDEPGQRPDIVGSESPAEVSRRGRGRERPSAQGLKVASVAAQPVDVIEGLPSAQEAVRDTEDVIGLVIGPVLAEQRQPLVDRLSKSERADQVVNRTDAAERVRPDSTRQLVASSASPDLGSAVTRRHATPGLPEAADDLVLLSS